MLGELLGLTYRFDAQTILDGGRWWGVLIAQARYLPQIALARAAAVSGLEY
jgi:hypothetical protein